MRAVKKAMGGGKAKQIFDSSNWYLFNYVPIYGSSFKVKTESISELLFAVQVAYEYSLKIYRWFFFLIIYLRGLGIKWLLFKTSSLGYFLFCFFIGFAIYPSIP